MRLASRRAALIATALVVIWGAAGLRRVDGARQFAVLDGPWPGLPVRVDDGWTIAPPGLFRLTRWARGLEERDLPRAAAARVAARDGSRFGLIGRVRTEYDPTRFRELSAASRGGALPFEAAVREAAAVFAGQRRGTVPLASVVRAFEEALGQALGSRGVLLDHVKLEGLDWLEIAAGEQRPVADRRMLVVGLDGADWAIVDPLLKAGRLPHLDRLIRNGVRAKLLSISPMISPVVWTSVATGVEPVRHGVLDFLVPGGRPHAGEPVTSDERRVPAVWEMLSGRGVPVGITAWWATWPAPEVHGYVISDRVAYQLFGFHPDSDQAEGKTWPADLYEAIRPHLVPPGGVRWEEILPYLSGPRTSAEEFTSEERERLDGLRTLVASGRTYVDAALEARRLFPPRFEAVYLEGTDTSGHLFMRFRAPRLPEADDAGFESFREVVDRSYEDADRSLGRLLENRGQDWTVMILSDHGFATDESRPRTTDPRIGHGAAADWHRRFGVLVLSGADIKPGASLSEATIYDIAPTILALYGQPVPKSWPGRVLGEVVDPAFFEAHPVVYTSEDPPVRDASSTLPEDPQAQEALEKLRSLGYIAAQAPPGSAASSVSTSNNRGVALMSEGRFEEAADAFRDALSSTPDVPVLLVNLGIALSFAGQDGEAVRHLERAFATPTTRRPAGLRLAQMHLKRGDLPAAEDVLRKVLEVEPGAADVRNTLGVVLDKQGRSANARAQFLEAARLDVDSAEPRNNLGNVARDAGLLEDAESWYLKAIEADPYFMGAYNNLALVYQDRGESVRAIELYGRALDKAPRNAVVMNNLASLYFSLGDDAEARRLWDEAVAADPEYVSPLNNLAGLALTEQRYEDAERLLRRALDREPGYGDARVNLSFVERALGRLDAARGELAKAARDPRARRTALYQLGVLELGAGRAGAARSTLEAARREYPGSTDILNALGEAYRRLRLPREAREAWLASLRTDPEQPAVASALKDLEKAD